MLTDQGGGWIAFDGVAMQPFPGWSGGFRLCETATDAYVGAGEGGGARYCVIDRATKRKTFDGFADGDTVSRGGVHFVPAAERPITAGSGFWLYLAFERTFPGSWKWDVAYRVAELFAGCGVGVTTARPKLFPGDYGVCVIGDGAAWFPEAGGNAPTNRFGLTPGGYDPQQVYALAFADARTAAAVAAHECGHGFGLGHDATPNSIMQPAAMPNGYFPDPLKARVRARTAPYSGRGRA